MELTSTSYVILGFLAGGVGSGYDIKALADKSVRFFWNLSYGQIYPELKRLADAGLAKATSDPNGSRKRTTYQLTSTGRKALRDWLAKGTVSPVEMRDEMLLKLFFSDAMTPGEQLTLVRAMRRRQESMVETLRAIEPLARQPGAPPSKLTVLMTGIALHQQYARSLAETERQLAKTTA